MRRLSRKTTISLTHANIYCKLHPYVCKSKEAVSYKVRGTPRKVAFHNIDEVNKYTCQQYSASTIKNFYKCLGMMMILLRPSRRLRIRSRHRCQAAIYQLYKLTESKKLIKDNMHRYTRAHRVPNSTLRLKGLLLLRANFSRQRQLQLLRRIAAGKLHLIKISGCSKGQKCLPDSSVTFIWLASY
jgi:hypothetical protein